MTAAAAAANTNATPAISISVSPPTTVGPRYEPSSIAEAPSLPSGVANNVPAELPGIAIPGSEPLGRGGSGSGNPPAELPADREISLHDGASGYGERGLPVQAMVGRGSSQRI